MGREIPTGTFNAIAVNMTQSRTLSPIQIAADMAARAHAGQPLRNTETPYIAHPVKVAMLIGNVFGCRDEEVAAAALLHDTLEKTGLTMEAILQETGPRVLHLVQALTKEPDGNRSEYWEMLTHEVWEARLIKLADALDHLDCPPEDLPRRLRSARRAMTLAHSNEEPIVAAREVLADAIRTAAVRLAKLP